MENVIHFIIFDVIIFSMENLFTLKLDIENIESQIVSMPHGAVQIRTKGNKKYIYVVHRDSGFLKCLYVGPYSKELHNLILSNNEVVKELKQRLKELQKEFDKQANTKQIELIKDIKLNIDLARRNLVDSIYKQSMLEGVATTYSDTQTLIDGGKVNNMSASDVQKVINLKHAWGFILEESVITYPTSYAILTQINEIVESSLSYHAGKIRSAPVTISGTGYLPPIPIENMVKEEIETIVNQKDKDDIDKAIDLICYVMKSQVFLDGNKRTAVIFGNHYLISHAKGLIVIPVEKLEEYRKLLIDYYESKNNNIKSFLRNTCYQSLK